MLSRRRDKGRRLVSQAASSLIITEAASSVVTQSPERQGLMDLTCECTQQRHTCRGMVGAWRNCQHGTVARTHRSLEPGLLLLVVLVREVRGFLDSPPPLQSSVGINQHPELRLDGHWRCFQSSDASMDDKARCSWTRFL